jgi:hypothetical protein
MARCLQSDTAAELARFDYWKALSAVLPTVHVILEDSLVSLVYASWSAANSSLEQLKAKSTDIESVSKLISASKASLERKAASLTAERQALELKLSVYQKVPQLQSDKEGYLWKWSRFSWKRRFFMVRDGSLVYLKHKKPTVLTPLLLSKVSLPQSSELLFTLELKSATQNKTHLLLAENEVSAVEWAHTLTVTSEQGLLGDSSADYRCVDCGIRGAEWCSLNLCVFLCIECSAAHRALGTTYSKVRSLQLDRLRVQTRKLIEELSARAEEVWESQRQLPRATLLSSAADREALARQKYIDKSGFAKILNPETVLLEAVSGGDLVLALRCLHSADSTADLLTCRPFMHEAVRTGNLLMLDLLVLNGCPPETQDSEGCTAAEVALLTRQHGAAAYLLKLLDNKVEE